jgi:hypothetical protein
MSTAAAAAATLTNVAAPPHLRNNFLPDDFKTVTTTPESVRETLLCGPLLRYSRTNYDAASAARWYGTVLLVVRDGDGAGAGALRMAVDDAEATVGEVLLRERGRAFVKFDLEVELRDSERLVRYEIHFGDVATLRRCFGVPGVEDTMRIMVCLFVLFLFFIFCFLFYFCFMKALTRGGFSSTAVMDSQLVVMRRGSQVPRFGTTC